jgi:hypothetical protein
MMLCKVVGFAKYSKNIDHQFSTFLPLLAAEVLVQSLVEVPLDGETITDQQTKVNAGPLYVEDFAVKIEPPGPNIRLMNDSVPFLVEGFDPVSIVSVRFVLDSVLLLRFAVSVQGFDSFPYRLFEQASFVFSYLIPDNLIETHGLKPIQCHLFILDFISLRIPRDGDQRSELMAITIPK